MYSRINACFSCIVYLHDVRSKSADQAVDDVEDDHAKTLVDGDLPVHEGHDKEDDGEEVKPGLSDKILERKLDLLDHDEAGTDDEQEVEEGGPHDGPGTHVRFDDAHTHGGAEHVGEVAPNAHEDGTSKVLAEVEDLAEHVEGGDKVDVADELEAGKDVEHQGKVHKEPALLLPLGGVLLASAFFGAVVHTAAAAVAKAEPRRRNGTLPVYECKQSV